MTKRRDAITAQLASLRDVVAGFARGRRVVTDAPATAAAERGARTRTAAGVPVDDDLGEPGPPLDHRAPFYVGFVGGLGVLVALWLALQIQAIGSDADAGRRRAVPRGRPRTRRCEFFERRGMRRSYAVLTVIVAVLAALALFVVAIVPVIADQVRALTDNAPHWLDELQRNRQVQRLDDEYDVIDKVQDYVTDGDFVSALFGGARRRRARRARARCSTASSSSC